MARLSRESNGVAVVGDSSRVIERISWRGNASMIAFIDIVNLSSRACPGA